MSSGCGDVLSLADLQTAKKHQIFEAEVITGKSGGVAGGADIDYATNAVTGQTQKTLPAILRSTGFTAASFDFSTGGTLTDTSRNVAVLWPTSPGGGDGNYYLWSGELPKVIPAGSSPRDSGGNLLPGWGPVYLSANNALFELKEVGAVESALQNLSVPVRRVSVISDIGDSAPNGTIVFADSGLEVGDLAGGCFTYFANRNLTPDGGIVINVGSNGQLVRYGFKKNIYPSPVNVQWYGAIPHNDTLDNAIPINAALASPYTSDVLISDYYLVRTSVVMQTKKSLVGPNSSWAYADSGYNMQGTIALSDQHSLAYLDPIVDCRYKRQTSLINIDIDGRGHDVTCIEYGRRVSDTSDSQSYNNHVRSGCAFRAARMGLRSDNAGLHKSFGEQITGCIEAGIYSENNFSDSTYVSPYINDIGYHSGGDPSDLRAVVGVGIHLGPHSGVTFIGGKIEYTRIHIQASGSSYTRFSNMWLDAAKRAAVVFMGSPDGSGRNNFIDNCAITGGGYTDPVNGAAVTIDGEFGPMSLTITGGNITATDENINPDATTAPTFGAKLAGVKVGNNPNGLVSINGTDMRKCSLSYTVYAYGNSRVMDRSISTLPNSVSGGSTVNGYAYDSGNESRGFLLREATDDSSAASSGVPVGGFYLKNTNQVCIRKS